ncbi:MAG: T9SS type A sorting domain-containing protein [Flavipsychrobacter sp.]
MFSINKYICFIALLFFVATSVIAQTTRKVLFLGNSYTYVNNLPQLVANAALSVGDTLAYDVYAPGGYTLQEHGQDTNATNKIKNQTWDYIVLQGQSQEPITKTGKFKGGAKGLNDIANQYNSCSVTMLYVTWGRKNGDPTNCQKYPVMCTYLGMDTTLRNNYYDLATDINAEVSPVSVVWQFLRTNNPSIDLYQSDGSHPSLAGSYAADCCFYSTIFKKDPTLITYNPGLTAIEASIIRNAVKAQVYNNLSAWDFKQAPTSDFFYEIGTGLNEVVLTHKYSPAVEQYSWTFGDGGTSSIAYPSHSYSTNGTYKITLTTSSCDLQGVHTSTSDTTVQFCSHTPTIYTNNPWVCHVDTLLTQAADAYQWVVDGVLVPENAQTLTNYRKYSGSSYSVFATVGGCTELSRKFTKTPDFSGYYFDIRQQKDPCVGDTVWFAALHINGSLSGAEHIFWYKNDTLLSAITNKDTMFITTPGKYKCGVVDPNSKCPIDTTYSSIIVFDCTTGIRTKNTNDVFWKFYPNPTVENITVVMNKEAESKKLQLFDMTGSLLKDISVSNNQVVNISDLPAGLYFLKLEGVPRSTYKLIKM